MDKQLNIVTSITFLTAAHNINIILTTVDMWITRILSIFINFRYCKYVSKYLRITGVFIKREFTDILIIWWLAR